MRLIKLALAVVGVTVLLGAVVSTASATRLSVTTRVIHASWSRMNFRGGLGTVECEVVLDKTFHSNTIAKTAGVLMGFITAGNLIRCFRGRATILRETLPWHARYNSFVEALPNITKITTGVIGFSYRIQEPTFGINCLIRSSVEQPIFLTYNRNPATGAITSATVAGAIRCQETSIVGTLEGTSSSITAHTVTLI